MMKYIICYLGWILLFCRIFFLETIIRVILQLYGDFRSGVGPHWFSIGCFCLHCFVPTCGACSEKCFESERRATCFSSLRAKILLAPLLGMPSLTDLECSSFKPPHYLQACTKNFPNMEGLVFKTINSLPKSMLS